ncbi:hypothetical protein [Plantactinospora soyae]|uniref:Uncharacterized protein n=1 Tax=Plantactinospora soyae TaxID=1544732 RepID=A0A927R1D2_9ACTN|nr:hypothetical protein [Plantactinospora soyae]MBE1489583.1 hypothetical protein [Plantactinospora soyae]
MPAPGHAHLNVLGRYATASSAPAEGLRQLGETPDVPEGDGGVDEEGVYRPGSRPRPASLS